MSAFLFWTELDPEDLPDEIRMHSSIFNLKHIYLL